MWLTPCCRSSSSVRSASACDTWPSDAAPKRVRELSCPVLPNGALAIMAQSVTDTSGMPTTPGDITAAVTSSFAGCADARRRELLQALVRHLHAFACEVGLTQAEWESGIAVLRATGDITDERRQEFVLWSDALGLSMLVDALANPLPEGATESTVLGPFYVPDSPAREYGESMMSEPAGTPAWVHGRVLRSADG